MGQYLDKLKRFEPGQDVATRNERQSVSPHNENGIPLKRPSIAPPVVPDSGSKMTYCERCGGGYWSRVTHKVLLQCGRCSSSDSRVETLFFPGGTPLPKSQAVSTVSTADSTIEQAATHAKPVYWETGNGQILGPATPECLARSGDQFWVVTTFEGHIRWINAEQLRSKKAFLEQREIKEVELIRSF